MINLQNIIEEYEKKTETICDDILKNIVNGMLDSETTEFEINYLEWDEEKRPYHPYPKYFYRYLLRNKSNFGFGLNIKIYDVGYDYRPILDTFKIEINLNTHSFEFENTCSKDISRKQNSAYTLIQEFFYIE